MLRFLSVLVISVTAVNGNECGRGNEEFPWNVGIYLESQNQVELVCLGTLIEKDAILTAAHCFCDNIREHIRNGTFYIKTGNLIKKIDPKPPPGILIKINKNNIHIHKHYKGISNFFENDLAIIKNKFNFNERLTPVCVDWSNDINDENLSGRQPIWHDGKITNAEQSYHDDCSDGSTVFQSFVTVDKACAKLVSRVSLTHQSEGASLVFSHSDRWYIKGVISMHDVTGKELSTYTNVRQYMNWISNIAA